MKILLQDIHIIADFGVSDYSIGLWLNSRCQLSLDVLAQGLVFTIDETSFLTTGQDRAICISDDSVC